MSDRIGLVGVITPGADGAPPLFEIIRHDYEITSAGPNVRPCDHTAFVLDTKWSTVTCGKCRERVDAFAALMAYALWWEDMKHRRDRMEDSEKGLHLAAMRRLRNLRDCPDASRAELDKALRRYWDMPLAELRTLVSRIDDEVDEARSARRQAKRDGGA